MKRLLVALLLLVAVAPAAMAAGIVEEPLTLIASFPGSFGAHTVRLDALVVRPDDGQRHPLAVISHGAPRDAADRPRMAPRSFRAQAREFARRGWAAVTFMRRGYGKSEGEYAEASTGCTAGAYTQSARAGAADIREVIRVMTEKPYVDGSRAISVGRSAGGFATVALAADPPPGLVAAISFAGGRGSPRPDEVCNAPALIDAFATFGKTSRIPMLWVYAENDHYFGPALARQLHKAFTANGGKAEFVAAASFGQDGHELFSRAGTPIWAPYVDAFLAAHQLRLLDRPMAIDDGVRYPNGLGDNGKAAFLDYLDAVPSKAFVMGGNGRFDWRAKRDSVEEAVSLAVEACRKTGAPQCHPVMIDDKPAEANR